MKMNIKKYLQDNLNNQQYKAAQCTDQNSIILAGAGSGKTRTLTYKIANLIFGENVDPHSILAVTFTNKAASEMKERLFKIAQDVQDQDQKEKQKEKEVPDFDKLIADEEESQTKENDDTQNIKLTNYSFFWTGTFHSIFLKILKKDIEKLDMGYDSNFGVYDQTESKNLIKKIIKENNRKDQIKAKDCQRKISELKNE